MTFVCGVDGSKAARDAASAAALLAGALGHRLVLVHAVERLAALGYAIHPYAFEGLHGYETPKEAGERLLEGLVGDLELGLSAVQRVEVGEPSHVLAEVAEEEGAEMVVVGTRARGRLASAILGSVSSAAVSLSSCPVLVVPSGGEIGTGTLVCAVDDSSAARQAARVARALGHSLSAAVILVHAVPTTFPPGMSVVPRRQAELAEAEQRDAETFLAALALEEGLGPDIERRVVFGSQAEAIRGLADEVNAALVVVGTRRRGALRSALAGSVSLDLKGDSSRPVLLVPAGARIPLRT
jgi:nucleotide-binding universal stress UspA family protein